LGFALLGFVGLQLGLALVIERWLPELRDPEYGYRARRLAQRTSDTKARIVYMLGSSRTTVGFKAGQIEEPLRLALHQPVVAFNFGFTGAGPIMQLIELRRLLAAHLQPDLLLIEVLPPLLAGQVARPQRNDLPVNRAWFSELNVLERYGRSGRDMQAEWWQDWPIPWYSHRFAVASRFFPTSLPHNRRIDWAIKTDESGWARPALTKTTPAVLRSATERTRREYAPYFDRFRLGGPSCRALREMLELCREQEIDAALVLMPEGSEFRSLYPSKAWDQIRGFLAETGREFAVPIIDAREWIVDEDFMDSHHLLLPGAVVFTNRLGREAVLPLLQARAQRGLLAGRN
jgi:hypothetical protein